MELYKRFFELIPAHYTIVIIGFLANSNMMAIRNCMSVAIVAMTKVAGSNNTDSTQCLGSYGTANTTLEPQNGREFDWDPRTQGLILSVYFYGFLAAQFVSIFLSPKISLKWTLLAATVVPGLATLLIPLAARHSLKGLIATRVIIGFFSGFTIYVSYQFSARWVPIEKRAFSSSLVYSGTNVGTIISLSLSGYLCTLTYYDGGWPLVFYVFGASSLLMSLVVYFFLSDYPTTHPGISTKEVIYLTEKGCICQDQKVKNKPWKRMLSSKAIWAVAVANFGHNWGLDLIQLQLPTYLSHVLHYESQKSGAFSALPWLLKTGTNFLSGTISDLVYRTWHPSITLQRKCFNTIAYFGSAAFIIGVTFIGCQGSYAVVLFCLSMGVAGFVSAGFITTVIDISPPLSGTVMGFSNSFASLAGIIAPYVTGYLTEEHESIEEWSVVFYIAAAVFVFTGTIFVIFGSAEDQHYDRLSPDTSLNAVPDKLVSYTNGGFSSDYAADPTKPPPETPTSG